MEENEPDTLNTSFLGTGWSFPPAFVRAEPTGEVLMTSDEDDIQASLRILLGTVPGERLFNPKYGLDMHEILFEPMSTTMTTLFKERVRHAILIYEPRINLLALDLDASAQYEGRVSLVIDYEIRATNSRYNLVYPFYLTDSNELRRTVPT